ncbi:MAG: insulinase family protein, partial [Anaerolineales bacterium]|nr:insulinase family protein [Anaerolineales bacterium]
TRRFQLANGLQVLHVPRPGGEVVGLALGFRVGARHERADQRGLSHLLEHLTFAGTARWTEIELRDQVAARGGLWNGFTNQEQTAYVTILPAGEILAGLEYLRQVGFEPRLGAEPLERERRVIESEAGQSGWRWAVALRRWLARRRLVGDVGEVLDEYLHPAPAQWDPTIGYPWTRRRLTLADVHAHHRRFYTTTQACLVVLGGRSTRAVSALIQQVFGGLPARPAEPQPPTPPAPLAVGRRLRLPLMTINEELDLVAAIPYGGEQDPDWPAISLLRFVIQEVLHHRLRTELGLVYRVDVDGRVAPDHGFLSVGISVPAKRRAEAERELTACLDRLQAGDLDAATWDRVCAQTRGKWVLARQDAGEFLEWLVRRAGAFERHPAGTWVTRLEAPPLDEGRRALGRLLAPERRLLIVQEPSLALMFGLFLSLGLLFLALAFGLEFVIKLMRAWLAVWV